MRKPPPSVWFWGSLLCLAGLTGLRFDLHRRADIRAAAGARVVTPKAEAAATRTLTSPGAGMAPAGPGTVEFEPAGPALADLTNPVARSVADTLGPDDSIYLSLKRHGVLELEVLHLIQGLRPVFDPRSGSRPGDTYALDLDSLDAVLRFEYTPSSAPEMPVVVTREEGVLVGEQLVLPLEERTRVVQLVVDDNLSNAVAASGWTSARSSAGGVHGSGHRPAHALRAAAQREPPEPGHCQPRQLRGPLGEDQLRAFTLWRDELVGLAAAYRERLQVAAGAAPPGI